MSLSDSEVGRTVRRVVDDALQQMFPVGTLRERADAAAMVGLHPIAESLRGAQQVLDEQAELLALLLWAIQDHAESLAIWLAQSARRFIDGDGVEWVADPGPTVARRVGPESWAAERWVLLLTMRRATGDLRELVFPRTADDDGLARV